MKFSNFCLLAGFSASHLFSNVLAWDPTDSLMDADQSQSGYLPNHNMDPNIVGGGSWGQIWAYYTGFSEQFYAKPLTFTPASTGRQISLSFSEQNRIYAIDIINGTLVATRDLGLEGEVPFLVSDLGNCNDISNYIGITGTPIIDNVTETIYFWSKSYLRLGGAVTGYKNGAYRFHGINAVTLQDVFPPVNIQGTPADNDPLKWFTGGTVLQRPALNLVSGVVLTGFGGHCDQYNYTGWVVGMSAKTGSVLTAYVTSGGQGSPVPDGTWNGGGGGCAIWMGGSMLPSDQAGRIFFVTGNGFQGVNQDQPASGRLKLSTLSEAVVNMAVNATSGKLTQQDYFEPYTYRAMDQGDRDLGSAGIQLMDPGTFHGTGVSRMGVVVGKNGVAYVVNIDNLGGYKLGPAGTDAIVQTVTMPDSGSVFALSGSYPLEGGYLYITPNGFQSQVYSLGFDSKGAPLFTPVATTPDTFAGRPGIGPPTVTTYKGQAGTAILWIVDPDAGLKAYYAVPSNGTLTKIPLPASPQAGKYQRPGFGNGRYVMGSTNGYIRGYGSPVQLPMTCTSPLDFGTLPIGQTATLNVSCTTNIKITSFNGFSLGKNVFAVNNNSLPTTLPLLAGNTFTFPVTFDLTAKSGSAAIVPGVQASAIQIITNNAVAGYAVQEPISLSGQAVSANPFITMSPLQVTFAGIVVGSSAADAGSAGTFVISNAGLSKMIILGMAYVTGSMASGTDVYHNLTTSADANGTVTTFFDANGYFSSTSMPTANQTVAPGSSITIPANFKTFASTGTFYTTLMVYTDGGNAYTIFVGSAASTPVAVLEYSTLEGGWNRIPSCTDIATGCSADINFAPSAGLTSQNIQLRFSNTGGSALTISKSKPNEGTVLGATNPSVDFAEGLTILPGKYALTTVGFSPGASILNAQDVTYTGTWTLNTDDLAFGVHSVNFIGLVQSKKTGPLMANGQAQFQYLGCYLDQTNGRLEAKAYNNATGNTNGWCQTQALSYGAVFAGTEYMSECYVGNAIASATLLYPDQYCSYACVGDSSQICGGTGGYLSLYYDSTRYFPSNGTIIGSSGVGPLIPQTISGGWNYAGCWSDAQNSRVMLGGINKATATTSLDTCAAFCASYPYFGVEYASECYCGTSLAQTSGLKADTDCNMICAGNATQFCGAGSRLSLYIKNGTVIATAAATSSKSATSTSSVPAATGSFTPLGCYTDEDVTQRTLIGDATTDSVSMTIEACGAYCKASAVGPFLYFGVEWMQECYCGNSLASTTNVTTDGRCNMACTGNANEICGGNYGMNVFSYANKFTATSTSVSTTAKATTTAAAATPTVPAIIAGGWSYLHCHSDNTTIRTLVGGYTATTDMTLEKCAVYCGGYQYFGVEYYSECYCSNKISFGSTVKADSSCNFLCKGSALEYCGGSGALTMYNNTGAVLPIAASSSSSSTVLLLTSSTVSSSVTSSSVLSTTSSSSRSSTSSSSSSSSRSSTVTTSSTSKSSTSSSSSSALTTSSSSSSRNSSSSPTSTSSSLSFSSSSSSRSSSSSSTTTSAPIVATTSSSTAQSTTSTSPTSSSSPSATQTSSSSFSSSIATSSSSSSSSSPTSTSSLPGSTSASSTSSSSVSVSVTSSSSSSSSSSVVASTSNSSIVSSSSTLASTSPSVSVQGSSSTAVSSTSNTISSTSSVVTSQSSSTTATIATSVTASSTSTSSTATPSVNPWQPIGCANDTAKVSSRALTGATYTSGTVMTQESCQQYCAGKNFPLAGVEYGSQCYCGATLSNNALLGQTGCTMPCNGENTELCGGTSRLNVFKNTAYVAPTIKTAVGWGYTGCWTELSSGRAIGTLVLTSTAAMTVELCVSTCQNKGLTVAGIEYGNQCFCGSGISTLSTKVDDAQCSVVLCPGNKAEWCSAGSRLQTYTMNTPISPA